MIEDKLSHNERVRLEALARACDQKFGERTESILEQASEFEKFIIEGKTDGS